MADPTRPDLRDVQFISDEEEKYFRTATIGVEAASFLQSDTGRHLWEKARIEYDKATDDLFKLDPYSAEGKRAFAEIKSRAWAAEHFMQWCVESIQDGKNAEAQLRHLREGD